MHHFAALKFALVRSDDGYRGYEHGEYEYAYCEYE